MSTLRASRTIAAPVEKVFETIAHIENFSKAVPHIVNVDFLSDNRTGVGARFRETRVMRGREASTELEVTEYEENERVRLVSDAGGTIWDTLFTVRAGEAGTELSMVGEAKPYKLLARLVNPLISPMLRKALAQDLDAIKDYCEAA
jgi:uncharacterized membrane protein